MKIALICDYLSNKNEETDYILKLINCTKEINTIQIFLITGGIDINFTEQLCIEPIINENFLYSNRSFRSFFKALTFLRRFCKENKIDIIHSNSSYSANIGYNTSYTVNVKTVQTIFRLSSSHSNLKQFRANEFIAVNKNIYEEIIYKNITASDNVHFIAKNDKNLTIYHIEIYRRISM